MSLSQAELADPLARRRAYKGLLMRTSKTWALAPARPSPRSLGAALRHVLFLFSDSPRWQNSDFTKVLSENSLFKELFYEIMDDSLYKEGLKGFPVEEAVTLLLFIHAARAHAGVDEGDEVVYLSNLRWAPTIRGDLRPV